MLRRETLYTLALALCVVALACGDDEERQTDDAGVSGAGGHAAEAGTGGRGGTGGQPAISCTPKKYSLDAWCERGDAGCGRSQSERLSDLCESQRGCGGSKICTHITVGSNSCGGSSILVIYGIDVDAVTYHYDAAGELLGVRDDETRCSPQEGQRLYGQECNRVGSFERAKCSDLDADGGTDDAGI